MTRRSCKLNEASLHVPSKTRRRRTRIRSSSVRIHSEYVDRLRCLPIFPSAHYMRASAPISIQPDFKDEEGELTKFWSQS
jgi:hypothetical protein